MEYLILGISNSVFYGILNYLLIKKINFKFFSLLVKVIVFYYVLKMNIVISYIILVLSDYLLLNYLQKDKQISLFIASVYNLFLLLVLKLFLNNLPILIFSNLVIFIMMLLYVRKIKFYQEIAIKYYLILSIINLLLLSLIEFISEYVLMGNLAKIVILSIILIIMIIECLIIKIFENQAYTSYLNRLNNQYQMTNQYLNDLTQFHRQVTKYQHDFNNHLLIINNLINLDVNQAKDYLKQLSNDAKAIKTVINCNNQYLNIIFNQKISQNPDLNFEIEIMINDQLNIDKKICSLLLNLIDNAINAAKLTLDKRISIKIVGKAKMLLIEISNSVKEKVDIAKIKTHSTRKGLLIIEEIVNDHQGMMEYQSSDDLLTCKIMINL